MIRTMTKLFILPLLLFATLSLWGQNKENVQRIPIKPIIVEGELTGVPEGTPVQFAFRSTTCLPLCHYSLKTAFLLLYCISGFFATKTFVREQLGTALSDNRVGGGQQTADLLHHRSVYGGSISSICNTPFGVVVSH